MPWISVAVSIAGAAASAAGVAEKRRKPMVKCADCKRTIRKVADIRDCERCQRKGTAAAIPTHHADDDWLTPAIIGYAIGSGFAHHEHPVETTPAFAGGGGETSGAGAGSTFEPEPTRESPSEPASVSSDTGGDTGGGAPE